MLIPSPIKSVCIALVLVCFSAKMVLGFDTRARAAFVIDLTTDTVLLAKNADLPLPPASMSKLMTLYVAFEALRDGRLTLEDRLPVSNHAMSYRGSTMFLDTTDRVRVDDLIKGIIVLSGNDACTVLAEALSPDGTEAGFARYMTKRAKELGMTQSTFVNANGWPAPGHVMSVRDLAIISERLITDFPELYTLFGLREFAFDGRAPRNKWNRNPLLGLGIGADGLKTGHTQEAGYGLVGSAEQNGRRIVFVLSGLESLKARAEEAEAVVNWAFRQFVLKTVMSSEQVIANASVWMGKAAQVGLVSSDDIKVLVPALGKSKISAEIRYQGPVQAPIHKGQELAEIIITPEGMATLRRPLLASDDIAMGGFFTKLSATAQLIWDKAITSQ